MTTTKSKMQCLLLPLVHDPLVSVSQQMMKSSRAVLKILRPLKCCVNFRGGWSLWWRRRSQGSARGEEVGQVVLQKRQLQRNILTHPQIMTPTKTKHLLVLRTKVKTLWKSLLKIKTRALMRPHPCRLLEGTHPTHRHICRLTCPC